MRWRALVGAFLLLILPSVAMAQSGAAQQPPCGGTNCSALSINLTGTTGYQIGGVLVLNYNASTATTTMTNGAWGNLGNFNGNTFLGNEQNAPASVLGAEITAVGDRAGSGFDLTASSTLNTFYGHNAGGQGFAPAGSKGQNNVALGGDCMRNPNGLAVSNNTCVGFGGMGSNVSVSFSGNNDTTVGQLAGNKFTTQAHSSIIGSGVASTTLQTGSYDMLIGGDTGVDTATASTSNAVGIGSSVKPGSNDVQIGNAAGASTTTDGNRSVEIGYQAATNASSAAEIVAIGDSALKATTINGSSVAIGGGAGLNSTGGTFTGIGVNTGKSVTTMTNFAGFGNGVGQNTCAAGSNVLLLGTNSATDCAGATESNALHIGAGGGDILAATGTGTPGTSVLTIGGNLTVANLATVGTIAGSICRTAAGVLLYESGATGCTISLEELKNGITLVRDSDAVAELMKLEPITFTWKDPSQGKGEQIGFGAHQVESVDKRLSTYDGAGNLQGYAPNTILALTVATVQRQQGEIVMLWWAIGIGGVWMLGLTGWAWKRR